MDETETILLLAAAGAGLFVLDWLGDRWAGWRSHRKTVKRLNALKQERLSSE